MARHLFFAVTIICTGLLLYSPAQAVTDEANCENNAANCVGRCANPGSGANDNKCMNRCDRHVRICLIRAYDSTRLWWR
jgi:hypothetical protein